MSRRPRVVMVGWRDPSHPASGGAEIYTRIALAGLVRSGLDVTWFVPWRPGLTRDEVLDGIRVMRRGRGPGHLLAAAAYLRRHAHEVDLVVDQANGYPMFTPLSYRGPRLLLIHQLARGVWFRHLPLPAAVAGYLLEPVLLLPYARGPAITVSASTESSLRRLGFRDVTVIPNAVQPPPSPNSDRARVAPSPPRYVGIGRLVPSKRFDHLLQAFALVRRDLPQARLTIIGRASGAYADHLERLVSRTEGAELLRDATEETKWRVLSEATALVATSVREGWGLMVGEAHAVGTPSVAYDVPGLRDSTRHDVNGLICAADPDAAAADMLRLARDGDLWSRLSEGAVRSVAGWTPDDLGRAFAEVVWASLRARPTGRRAR